MTTELLEWYDSVYYQDRVIEPGQRMTLFGSNEEHHGTNWHERHERKLVIAAIGLRCLGSSRADEDLLLDHIEARIIVNDKTWPPILGPVLSTLRHVFSREELDRLQTTEQFPSHRVGYHFQQPILVRPQERVLLEIRAQPTLPRGVRIRGQLFAISQRELV